MERTLIIQPKELDTLSDHLNRDSHQKPRKHCLLCRSQRLLSCGLAARLEVSLVSDTLVVVLPLAYAVPRATLRKPANEIPLLWILWISHIEFAACFLEAV